MKLNMFKVSRHWNKLAYFIINIGRKMVWDYTGRNSDILGEYTCSETTEEIMTFTGK
jgi:hypothetical protein